ncbi:unnamed protein product [marine sediment metagenome]|uniref:Uncharacterized protein n=1 Tax=marine sediment metagenome TaxID=412755 RepID=X1A390_9ZZZZ
MRRDTMRLTITLIKTFDNEANMQASRDSVKTKAVQAGYHFSWDCKG